MPNPRTDNVSAAALIAGGGVYPPDPKLRELLRMLEDLGLWPVPHALDVPYAATLAVNVDRNVREVRIGTLTGPLTLDLTGGVDGQMVTVRFTQDGTGGRLLTIGSSIRLTTTVDYISLSTDPDQVDYLVLKYHAASGKYDAVAIVQGISPSGLPPIWSTIPTLDASGALTDGQLFPSVDETLNPVKVTALQIKEYVSDTPTLENGTANNLAITDSTIDGTIIGGSTPTNGSFTTLQATDGGITGDWTVGATLAATTALFNEVEAQQINGVLIPPVPADTVANLPFPSSYTRMFVTDSTVAAAGNFGAVVVGGGGFTVPVYNDGSDWRIG